MFFFVAGWLCVPSLEKFGKQGPRYSAQAVYPSRTKSSRQGASDLQTVSW